jgi:hypothetical protein
MILEPPTGTVTFLFTDIEGSTKLWEKNPEAMQAALARHDEILRGAIESNLDFTSRRWGMPSAPPSPPPQGPYGLPSRLSKPCTPEAETKRAGCAFGWPYTPALPKNVMVTTSALP